VVLIGNAKLKPVRSSSFYVRSYQTVSINTNLHGHLAGSSSPNPRQPQYGRMAWEIINTRAYYFATLVAHSQSTRCMVLLLSASVPNLWHHRVTNCFVLGSNRVRI